MNSNDKSTDAPGFSGVLGAIEKLAKLADKLQSAQDELKSEGEVEFGKNSKASYSFRVRTLSDAKREQSKSNFRPFTKPASSKKMQPDAVMSPLSTIEPETDVFLEGEFIVIYVQLPGVLESEILMDVHSNNFALRAKSTQGLYQKELSLPAIVLPESLSQSLKNGILEVRLAVQKHT